MNGAEVRLVALDRITVEDRIRHVTAPEVAKIAHSFAETGQITPIEVVAREGGFRLVAGAHRMEAAKLLGWTEIEARIADERDDIDLRLREIDENLHRRELSPLDQAVCVAERRRLWEIKNGAQKRGRKKKNNRELNERVAKSLTSTNLTAADFMAATQETFGLSATVLKTALRRFKRLDPEARRLIAGTAVAENGREIDALAMMHFERQIAVARTIGERGCLTVAAALEALDGVKTKSAAEIAEATLKALKGAWARADGATRRAFIGEIGGLSAVRMLFKESAK